MLENRFDSSPLTGFSNPSVFLLFTCKSLSLAAKLAGMGENDIEKCLLAIDSIDVKRALKNTTEEAINYTE